MSDAALEIVARNVRSARAAAGLSLDALAGRAEVSKGALVALEGARGNPNFATLVRLADALGRSVSSLMEDAREEPVVVVDRSRRRHSPAAAHQPASGARGGVALAPASG
jgi:transcriptional regulator with XRE-family HTH domain